MLQGPKLKPIFTEQGGGKEPRPQEPVGLMDMFKAKAVDIFGPSRCKKLDEALKAMLDQHTVNGAARDVTTHFALQAMSARVTTLRDTIRKGGPEGFTKMNEASQYVSRIQQYGLEA